MPRFVILEHDHPELHWDLLLECGPVLRAWRLAAFPRAGQRIAAAASFPHRLVYLDYEGAVSGNRGQVKRSDAGHFEWITPPPIGEVEEVIVHLQGTRVRGRVQLHRIGEEWSLMLVSADPS
jgi:hypothetical protein